MTQPNVVIVGFLSTGDLNSPGNYGLWDQRRALEWIRNNIQSFRGNPNIITIFGQSTGASSVGLHLLSPRSISKIVKVSMAKFYI